MQPGARAYFETQHPKTVDWPSAKGQFTLNFYDDETHVKPVSTEVMAETAKKSGLVAVEQGVSRNWLFAASWPILCLTPASRKRFTARVHWGGWSAFLIARKPIRQPTPA